MALTPINELINIKPRPETTLTLDTAVANPKQTIEEYVFTRSLKAPINDILDYVNRHENGKGYWVVSEYGGGKTHFLATVSALLSDPETVTGLIEDEDVQQNVKDLRGRKVFPVAFSLLGRDSVIDRQNRLFLILEEEISKAAQNILGPEVDLRVLTDVQNWRDSLDGPIRDSLDTAFIDLHGKSPDQVLIDSPDDWINLLQSAADRSRIGMMVDALPIDRLKYIYSQIVNDRTGFTGILIIIDEMASWIDKSPVGDAYTQTESLLQLLADDLAKEMCFITVVASQQDMPLKFQPDRFRGVDILGAKEADENNEPAKEYAQVVSGRVRSLVTDKSPEIEEYYNHYSTKFDYIKKLSLDEFRDVFPVQPICFDMLRRASSNLTETRIGINALWDVLGDARESKDGKQVAYSLKEWITGVSRLITAADLLRSPSLIAALTDSGTHKPIYDSYLNAVDQIQQLKQTIDMDQSEFELANSVLGTAFLWHIARRGQLRMTLGEMAEAVVAEHSDLSDSEGAVLNVVALMEGIEQLDYNSDDRTFAFAAKTGQAGPTARLILNEYKKRQPRGEALQSKWESLLTDQTVIAGDRTAIFREVSAGMPSSHRASYDHVMYSGEHVIGDWTDNFAVALSFDNHYRLVYLQKTQNIHPNVLSDERIAVCVPGEFSENHQDALVSYLALEEMQAEYLMRDDGEAERVRLFYSTERPTACADLINAQRSRYQNGSIVTRSNHPIDAGSIFSNNSPSAGLADQVMASEYKSKRPIGAFSRNQVIDTRDTTYLFEGLFGDDTVKAHVDALDNFSVALGLALPGAPRKFDSSNCSAFDRIKPLILEAIEKDQLLNVQDLYSLLVGLGIPAALATLYLLALIRAGDMNIELSLRPNHKLQLKDKSKPTNNLIASNTVPRIAWNTRWASADCMQTFDAIAKSSGLSWNDALEWTRVINLGLLTANNAAAVAAEDQKLVDGLGSLQLRNQQCSSGLDILATGLQQDVPEEVLVRLNQEKAIYEAQSYGEFVEIAKGFYSNPEELGDMCEIGGRWSSVAQQSANIVAAYNYLSIVPPNKLETGLEEQRNAIKKRFQIESLLDDETGDGTDRGWNSLKGVFDTWRTDYQVEYRKFHRDYHDHASRSSKVAEDAEYALKALTNLENLGNLPITGEKHANRLIATLQGIKGRLRVCGVPVDEIEVGLLATCQSCQLRIGEEIELGIDNVLAEIQLLVHSDLQLFKIKDLYDRLTSSNVQEVQDFVKAIVESGNGHAIELLQSPDLIVALGEAIQGHQVGELKELKLSEILSSDFPAVSSDDLDAVGTRVMEILLDAMASAQLEAGDGVKVQMRIV